MAAKIDRDKVRRVALADLQRARDYYEQTIEPTLLGRRRIYEADKEMYKRMYPSLGYSDYTSHDFYSWVQWALAVTLDSFFGTNKAISIVGQGQSDSDSAETMSQLIKWQTEQQNKGFVLFSSWFEEALTYDFGVLKCWWSRKVEPRDEQVTLPPDRLMMMAQTPGVQVVQVGTPDYFGDTPAVIRRMVTTDNRPVLDHVSPFDMRWLPEARKIEDSLFVAQRQIVTGDVIMQGVREGVYDKKEAIFVLDNATSVDWSESDREINPDLDAFPTSEEDKARRHIELYECYIKMDVNGDGALEDLIVTIAEDRLLRVEVNPLGRLPFFVLSSHRDPSRVLPESSMADIEGELQHLRVAMVRQILLNISNNNRPQKFVDETKINIDDLLGNKALVRCKGDPRTIMTPVPSAPLAPWTMDFIEYLKAVEEDWTGKTRYNQGTDANTLNKTATGISLIMRSSAQRINHIVKVFAETGVGELHRFLVKLNQTYIDQQQVIRLLDKPLTVMPDDLDGDFDIVVNADIGLGEKEQKTNVLTSYLRELFPFARQLGIAGPADFSKAAVRLLELMGWKDAQQFLRSPEEIQMQQQQQAMQQQMMMQQQQDAKTQAAAQRGAEDGLAAAMKQKEGMVRNGQQGNPNPAGSQGGGMLGLFG